MSISSTDEIFMDEFFDGWLSAPSIANFLAQATPPASRESFGSRIEAEPSQSVHSSDSISSKTPATQSPSSEVTKPKRRGYSKSRLGCINCKKRKIKCQETWPSCANCKKRGFICRYPAALKPLRNERMTSELVADVSLRTLQPSDTSNVYSPNDMLLFHYYLTAAYPHIPDGYDNFWVKEVAICSHQYAYLMHSILAMSASHLALHNDDQKNISIALMHRQKAIVGLEEAFTRWPTEAEEAHVMFAASSLLATQSNYMPDGFLDSILSQRGCALISQKILENKLQGVFAFTVTPEFDITSLELSFRNYPKFDQEIGREALRSLAGFASLLSKEHRIERDLTAQIAETVRQLLDHEEPEEGASNNATPPDLTESNIDQLDSPAPSNPPSTSSKGQSIGNPYIPFDLSLSFDDIPWETVATVPPISTPNPRASLRALTSVLSIMFTWPPDALLHLFSPTNRLGNIVLAHILAVRFVIPSVWAPKDSRVMMTPLRTAIDWLTKCIDTVEDDSQGNWTQHVAWPRKVQRCLQHSMLKKRRLNYSDLIDIVLKDPGAFREGRARRVVAI